MRHGDVRLALADRDPHESEWGTNGILFRPAFLAAAAVAAEEQ